MTAAALRRGAAGPAGRTAFALVSVELGSRNRDQRSDVPGVFDPLVLDRLPDRPGRDAKLGGSFLHQHVITLHASQHRVYSRRLIDYSTGTLPTIPCIIFQSNG